MGLSSKEIIGHFAEKLALVAGEAGLDSQIIERITVMETIDFALGAKPQGLFVLTTLYTMTLDPDRTLKGVRHLFEHNLAGLAVKLNRFVERIPEDIVQWADEYQVPVFSIKRDVMFSDFIAEFADSLFLDRRIEDSTSIAQCLHMARAISQNGTIDSILVILSGITGGACCFFSNTGEIASIIDPVHFWNNSEALRNLGGKITNHNIFRANDKEYYRQDDLVVIPCRIGSVYLGCLTVSGIKAITDSTEMIFRQAIAHIAIRQLEALSTIKKNMQLGNPLFDEVMLKKIDSKWQVIERLQHLGLNPEKNFVVIAGEIDRKLANKNSHNIITLCRDRLKLIFENIIIQPEQERLTAIFSYSHQSKWNEKNAILYAMIRFRDEVLKDNCHFINFGISLSQTDYCEMPCCYDQAKTAIHLGQIYGRNRHIYSYHAFVIQGLLSYGKNSPEYQYIRNEIVTPIKEHDAAYDSLLWKTLDTLFKVRSQKEAADDLYIHISTLRYRIQKIQDITGFDYYSPYGRYQLHTAYLIYQAEST
jgi:purine catabolism regulator